MEEQYIDPNILNELNNTQSSSQNNDFGLEGFFDDAPDEEMTKNRENVFGILDSAEMQNSGMTEEQYRLRFEQECTQFLGTAPKRNSSGAIIPIKPQYFETQALKQRYGAIGFALLIFLLLSSILPYLLIYSGVFGMLFADSEKSSDISYLDTLFNNVMDSTGGYMLVNAGTVLVALLFATWFGCKSANISVKSFFAPSKIGVRKTLAYSTVGFFLQIIANIILMIIETIAASGGKELSTADFSTNLDTFAMIVTCVYTIIIAPFIEELFFRGFILNNVSKISRLFGMFVSAFLFALYHMNIPQFVSAFFIGLLLSYVTLKADSIVPAIIIHAINNCISMALTIITEYNQSLGDTVSMITIYGLALIGLIVFIVLSRKEGFPQTDIYEKNRCLPVAIKTASLNIATLLMIAMTALYMFS